MLVYGYVFSHTFFNLRNLLELIHFDLRIFFRSRHGQITIRWNHFPQKGHVHRVNAEWSILLINSILFDIIYS